MKTERKMSAEEERTKVANAIPWGLLKIEKKILPVYLVIFAIFVVRLYNGFVYTEGEWILGLPAPVFESYAWGVGFLALTIITTTLWIREVRQRIRKTEEEAKK